MSAQYMLQLTQIAWERSISIIKKHNIFSKVRNVLLKMLQLTQIAWERSISIIKKHNIFSKVRNVLLKMLQLT